MKKALCATLVAAMTLLPLQPVRAEMITLHQGLASDSHALSEGRISLQKTLESFGVPAEEAQARVAALSDEEAQGLAAQAAAAPAGGNAAFLVVALILVFFLWVNRSMKAK